MIRQHIGTTSSSTCSSRWPHVVRCSSESMVRGSWPKPSSWKSSKRRLCPRNCALKHTPPPSLTTLSISEMTRLFKSRALQARSEPLKRLIVTCARPYLRMLSALSAIFSRPTKTASTARLLIRWPRCLNTLSLRISMSVLACHQRPSRICLIYFVIKSW